MNQHGFARDMDFTLISRSTDEAWLALEDTDETRKVYPFHFHLEIGYRLEETAVRVMWKVKNTNEKNMYLRSVRIRHSSARSEKARSSQNIS